MNIFKTKYNVENINPDEIDDKAFYKCLLICVSKIKDECKRIDRKINRIAKISFIPGMSTTEHYETIVDLTNMKARLINLYHDFNAWFEKLPDEQKDICTEYLMRKDVPICIPGTTNSMRRQKNYVLNKFTAYIAPRIDNTDLIKCPAIYSEYIIAYNKELANRKEHKGDNKCDDSRNEKCDSRSI